MLNHCYRGPPSSGCVDAINDYVWAKANTIAGLAIAIGVLLLFGVVGSFIVICCLGNKIKITSVTTYKYEILDENIIM